MYYVVYFDEESCYDVRSDSQIVYDGPPPVVGQIVEAAYKLRSGGSRSLYEAKIIHITDTAQEAETLLESELKTASQETENEEPNKGRGKREKKRKFHVLLENKDGDLKKDKKSNSSINLKDMKRRELLKVARDIKTNSGDDEPSKEKKLILSLKEENEKLKIKVRQLEKEKADATELGSWLATAKQMVEIMGNERQKSNQLFSLPSPSMLSSSSAAPSTGLLSTISSPVPFRPSSPDPSSMNNQIEVSIESFSTPTSRPKDFSFLPSFPSPIQTLTVGAQPIEEEMEINAELEFYAHKGSGNDVVELVEKSGVYIGRTALSIIKMGSIKTHSTIARALLSAVFKREALEICSLMGKAAHGPKGKPDTNRRALPVKGVMAVFEASTRLAQDLSLPIEDKKLITKSLGTKLSECRKQHTKKLV